MSPTRPGAVLTAFGTQRSPLGWLQPKRSWFFFPLYFGIIKLWRRVAMVPSTERTYQPKGFDTLLTMSDQELHAEYWRGDERNSPDILHQRHFRRTVAFIVRVFSLLRNEAEEIADDAILAALSQPVLEGPRGFEYFVHAVARHRALDRVRQLRRQMKDVSPADERTERRSSRDIQPGMGIDSQEELRTAVEECRRHLTEREREVLYWRLEGLTLVAIGEKLGCTHENCRQTWNRAVDKLRRSLQARGYVVKVEGV